MIVAAPSSGRKIVDALFLISLCAGGVGLNLTAADYVIHIDLWWNPAVERQASDRTHRIGQDKPVFVYKLIMRDTVEEKILELQERKRALVEQLVATEESFFKSLSYCDVERERIPWLKETSNMSNSRRSSMRQQYRLSKKV